MVGPNGAGKVYDAQAMAGLLVPWSGRIEILGAPAGRESRRVAYVPQAEMVDWAFPVTVEDVVMMGRFPRLGPVAGRVATTTGPRRRAGAGGHGPPPPDRRSGSCRAGSGRAFLARALAAEPDLFLLDEPVTGIDATPRSS